VSLRTYLWVGGWTPKPILMENFFLTHTGQIKAVGEPCRFRARVSTRRCWLPSLFGIGGLSEAPLFYKRVFHVYSITLHRRLAMPGGLTLAILVCTEFSESDAFYVPPRTASPPKKEKTKRNSSSVATLYYLFSSAIIISLRRFRYSKRCCCVRVRRSS